MKLSRPKSIFWFERLFVASLFLSALQVTFNWIEDFSDGDFTTGGSTGLTAMMLLITFVSFAIDIGFWYFIARRASHIAKWLLIVKTTVGLAGTFWVMTKIVHVTWPVSLLVQLLIILSIIFLFRHDASRWFHTKGVTQENVADLAEKFR